MITKQQADELKAAIDKMVEPEPAKWDEWPKVGDPYFHLRDNGVVYTESWDGTEPEVDNLLRGNIYRTREEAELADKSRLAYVELVEAIKKANDGWVPDWGHDDGKKWSISYSRWVDCVIPARASNIQSFPNELYVETGEAISKIIFDLGDEKIKLAMGWK